MMFEKETIMNDSSQKLYELAAEQNGLFTAAQAVNCGYPRSNHSYHVKVENWTKVIRGVFKLSNFPESTFDHLTSIYLWTLNSNDTPQGVFSHETALDIYDLSDVNPNSIHLSVPRNFRNKITDDLGSIELHKRDVTDLKTKEFEGVIVTTPLQTLLDVVDANNIDTKLVIQAVNQSFKRGLVSIRDFKKNETLKKYLRGKNVI